jgi:hypothetical protein
MATRKNSLNHETVLVAHACQQHGICTPILSMYHEGISFLRVLPSRLVEYLITSPSGCRLDEFVPQRTSAYIDQRDVHIAELSVSPHADWAVTPHTTVDSASPPCASRLHYSCLGLRSDAFQCVAIAGARDHGLRGTGAGCGPQGCGAADSDAA